ncbi:putative N-acetyltransferase YhbS [Ulvibacter sp. MAR_2010_11]|uniref:GNAT family N-acetyltransferase n=1 Tax=Ulvibacter sp. MAR_2010_11 TaxID=1250229 RepID=UPI000C2CCDEE|nr:GNAT family N-acetyltransferase [Ulvibacter sp. MAR_2010_11]PKA83083.1 putative N-acetyltransferase YhbS [Ulvibacter sp. MAR_2010_11]
MEIKIRKATKEDMSSVRDLIVELAVFEKEPDAVEVTVEDLQEAGFGSDPKFSCFVAEFEATIVGMALVYFRFSTWKGRTLHLEDLVVKERMRGKGVGEALYTQVLKFGHEKGVKRVQWEVLGWNEGAIKFYERSGANVLRDWHVVHMDEKGMQNYLEKL